MRMKNRNKSSLEFPQKLSADSIPQQPNSYEGESLLHLLNSIQREIKSVRVSDESLPYKIWLKQQFSIGVNDVTRVLERMPPVHGSITSLNVKASSLQMQAILIATDCNPRSLTKHLPILASSRGVSVIFVKDKKGGSFKLGEIVNLKTAMAIGIKDQESHCEGKERVERHELFMKWRPRFMMAGFTQCPLSSYVNSVIKNLLKCYSENYMLVEKDGAMLLGWKERNLISAPAWH